MTKYKITTRTITKKDCYTEDLYRSVETNNLLDVCNAVEESVALGHSITVFEYEPSSNSHFPIYVKEVR